MRFHIHNLKFRYQILVVFTGIFLAMSLGSGVAFYRMSAENVTDNFTLSAKDSVSQIGNTLETRLGIISERARAMLINQNFSNALERYLNSPTAANTVAAQGILSASLKDFEQGESLIEAAYLYTSHGDFDSYTHIRQWNFDFRDSIFYRVYENERMASVQWLTPMQDVIFTGGKWVLPCVIRFTVGGYQQWQYLIYQIDLESLKQLLEGQNPFFDDIVIFDAKKRQILGEKLTEGDSSQLVESLTIANEWTICGVKSRAELLESLSRLRMDIMKVALGLLGLGVFFAFVTVKNLTDALSRLERDMLCVRGGDLDVRFFYPYEDEVGSLAKSFNYMVGEIQSLVTKQEESIRQLRDSRDRVSEVQRQKRKAELKALQAQINPHFLYNTLNAITWQVADQGLEEVSLMASSLGKFFRLSLSKGEEIISLADEVEHVRAYLNIQGIRYRDKLRYELDISQELLSVRVLKLILQPLVENSIYHGIKEKKGGGTIRILAKRAFRGEEIVMQLEVWDDGVGIEAESLLRMNEDLRAGGRSQKEGYGIYNVNERLMLYYGEMYGLSYESVWGEYTKACLTLPMEGERECIKY